MKVLPDNPGNCELFLLQKVPFCFSLENVPQKGWLSLPEDTCLRMMDFLNWLGKPLEEIKNTPLYMRYFDAAEVENIERYYFVFNPSLGLDITFDDRNQNPLIIKAIHFYGENHKKAKAFKETLPFEISLSDSKRITRLKLGNPSLSGGGDLNYFKEKVPFWDKYVYDNYFIHLTFNADNESIGLLTIEKVI